MEEDQLNMIDHKKIRHVLECLVKNYQDKLSDPKIKTDLRERDFMTETIGKAQHEISEIRKWENGYSVNDEDLVIRALEEFIEDARKPNDVKERLGIDIPTKKLDLKSYERISNIYKRRRVEKERKN